MDDHAPLYAVQHIRKMRGGAQAHLLRASDNNYYVTKFQNNPQDPRILANEFLGSKLGSFLGLPMPDVRVIEVSDWLIERSPEMRIDAAGLRVPCAAGSQLGSRYVADPERDHIFDYLPESMFSRLQNRDDFARVLAFDKWTCNSDGRQAVFVKRRHERKYRAVFIDQGYCFNAGEWSFPDRPLRGVYARNSAYETVIGWDAFEPTLGRIQGIERTTLQELASQIPETWYVGDVAGLTRLLDRLIERRDEVRSLITDFRNSSRQPFPHWLD